MKYQQQPILHFLDVCIKTLSLLLIGFYRTLGTQFFGGNCRFIPSCSEYAAECFHQHEPNKALKLTFFRLCKCRPGGPFGFDPVPKRTME